MNTETVIKRKVGRPALGNVLFAKRVSPAIAARLGEIVAHGITWGDEGGAIPHQPDSAMDKAKSMMLVDVKMAMELEETKKQLGAMTNDYQAEFEKAKRLELELVVAARDMDDCLAMTEDDKVRYWRDRAFRAEAAIKAKGGEFDQTQ